jgi:cytochrome c-type biogenesis protein
MVVGLAFAFGWTPCIGPMLASILSLAATAETMRSGIALLTAYSLGLGIPFLLSALAFDHLMRVFSSVKRHMRKVELASGLLLVALGVLLMTNGLARLSALVQQIPGLGSLSI